MGVNWRQIRHSTAAAAAMLFGTMTASSAMAQRGTPCDSCQSCTTALASSGARVEVVADLIAAEDGACIVIRGADSILDGLERDLRAIGAESVVAVRVEADRVQVKNLHVVGAAVGIEVESAKDVTLFHNYVQATQAGVWAKNAPNVRLVRNVLLGGHAGVNLGGAADGTCADGAELTVPGAVLNNNHIERAETGVAACAALPVMRNNRVVRNTVGARFGSPKTSGAGAGKSAGTAAPWDECICAPAYPGVTPGSALFYSSGCKGCQIHEEWLVDLKAKGHEIVLRPSGPENVAQSAEFDAYIGRCIPQILDSIGIAGCVPNYGCLTNDVTFKIRDGDDSLERETEVNSAEQLASYEVECQKVARAHYDAAAGPGGCVKTAIHDNIFCESVDKDVAAQSGASAPKGANNACASAAGWSDSGADACASPCPPSIATPEPPAARLRDEAVPSAPPSQPVAKAAVPAPVDDAPKPPPVQDTPVEASATRPDAAVASAPPATTPVAVAQTADTPTAVATATDGKTWAIVAAAALALAGLFAALWLRARGAQKS